MTARNGFTLLETLATMIIVVIIGAVTVPTLQSLTRDNAVKEAGDILRAKVSAARSHAISEGRAYRVSVAEDGTRVRVTVDDETEVAADDSEAFYAEEPFPITVQATPVQAAEGQMSGDDGGWLRVATFLPDGTCREDTAEVDLSEPGCYTLRLTVRGLTGGVTLSKVFNNQ